MQWWDELSKEEQEQYLKEHPKSKLKVKETAEPEQEKEINVDDSNDGVVQDAANKINEETEDNEDYQQNKKVVEDYLNNGKDVDDEDDEAISGARLAAGAMVFAAALILAAYMPENADSIFAASYAVCDTYVTLVGDKELNQRRRSSKADNDSDQPNNVSVELLPEEEDKADERKRNLLREISTDENGEYVTDKYKPEETSTHLASMFISALGKR